MTSVQQAVIEAGLYYTCIRLPIFLALVLPEIVRLLKLHGAYVFQ